MWPDQNVGRDQQSNEVADESRQAAHFERARQMRTSVCPSPQADGVYTTSFNARLSTAAGTPFAATGT